MELIESHSQKILSSVIHEKMAISTERLISEFLSHASSRNGEIVRRLCVVLLAKKRYCMVRFDFLPSASFLSCMVYVFNWFWSTVKLYHTQT